ncbi:phage tail protein I [Azotobacter vinelandii]
MSSALLPPNSTGLERALAEVAALDHLSPETVRRLWNPQTCPASLLPWLAWALSVDFWDDAWPLERQRAVIAGSIAWHRKKGTPWAVKEALAAIGYPDSQLIEHHTLHGAWQAAGGELLDGTGHLDGTGDLSAPGGVFRVTTRHWAEYVVRLNVGEVAWSRARQREAMALCNAYAPARSQLAALIVAALHAFDASVTLAAVDVRARVRLADCRRFVVAGFDTLDGCDLLGGENRPESLDGLGTLDGEGRLNGYRATGEPLDAGQLGMSLRGRVRLPALSFGGDAAEAPEILDGGHLLDGRYTIAGDTLDGYGALDGGSLRYPSLADADDTLDGTSNLGARRGPPHIHHRGLIRIRRGSTVIQEPLQ